MASLSELGAMVHVSKAIPWREEFGPRPDNWESMTPKQQQQAFARARQAAPKPPPPTFTAEEHRAGMKSARREGRAAGAAALKGKYEPNLLGRWGGRRMKWGTKAAVVAGLGGAGLALSPNRRQERNWNRRKGISHAGRERHAKQVDRRTVHGAATGAGLASAGYVGSSYALNSFGATSSKPWSPAVGGKNRTNQWMDEVNAHKKASGVKVDPSHRVERGDSFKTRWKKNRAARRLRNSQLDALQHAYKTMPSHIPGSNVTRAGARLYGPGTIGRRAGLVAAAGGAAGGMWARGRTTNKYNKDRPPKKQSYPYTMLPGAGRRP